MDDRPPVVVVTGSASGIGRAVSNAYLDSGAVVAGLDVAATQPEPEGMVGDRRWLPMSVDVSDEVAVSTAIGEILDEHRRVGVLVASAGVGLPEPFLDIDRRSWDRVMAVNVAGTALCIQAVLPSMIEAGTGSIVVVSSVAGRTKSVANGAHYTCSKYALVGLVRHLAAELAGTGVRINCVAPGPTDAPILNDNITPDQRAAIIESTPLRRIADPSDVAEAIVFMASPQAKHIHGAVLDVNGGLY